MVRVMQYIQPFESIHMVVACISAVNSSICVHIVYNAISPLTVCSTLLHGSSGGLP